ncbi:tetratricopeptide repeat-containing glycosyltransferase [Blastopirellula marina]|nr:glycosyltransferase [Blastopirellula marina]
MESYYSLSASLLLLGAECWGILLMFLYFFQIWDSSDPDPVPPLKNRTVDVFLPTYNEDVQLLRGSINALNQLDYPHTTYVLDDGRRAEVAELCREMGVEYISRENNMHAKAGNLNNALDRTSGEFVVIFDADHVTRPNFISRTLGYFADEKLAFVQTPHAFYNFDSFQSHIDYKRGIYWEEGQLFYNVIQPGKNNWNANVFCGSAAIFRRSALQDVGLIATETITEDMHTGLRIHAKGWKSLFVNERMISAQAAPDITTFTSQRLRWGEGNLSIFAYDNPLTMKGLTLGQRLNYLGSMLGWTTGPAKAVLYATPILMLFTGVSPVGQFSIALGLITLFYMLTTLCAVKIASDGYGRLWDIEVQAMTNFWIQCRCLTRALWQRGRGKFVVTSKRGRQSANITALIAPHIVLIALGVSAIAWATAKIFLGVSSDYFGLIVGGALIAIQSMMAFQVIRKSLRPADKRFSWRHPTNEVHVRYQADALAGQAVSLDVNETGLGVVVYQALPVGSHVDLTLSTTQRTLRCQGEVRSCQQFNGGRTGLQAYRIGFKFVDLTGQAMSDLWSISAETAVERQYQRLDARFSQPLDPKTCRLPLELACDAASPVVATAVSSTVEDNSLLFESKSLLPLNEEQYFRIDSPAGQLTGRGKLEQTPKLHEYRLFFNKFDGQSRSILKSILTLGSESNVAKVVNPIATSTRSPLLRPAIESGWLALAASVLCIASAWYLWNDNYFLSYIAQSETLTIEDQRRADTILTKLLTSQDTLHNPTVLFDARAVLEMMGDSDRLAKLEELILADYPRNTGLKLARANRLLKTKQTSAALAEFKAIETDLNSGILSGTPEEQINTFLGTARSASDLNDIPLAIAAYQQALDRRRDPQAALELANLLVDQEAYDDVRRLLSILPGGYESRLIQARLDFADGNIDQALTSLETLTNEHPTDHLTRRLYAESLAQTGQSDLAIIQFQTLVQSDYETQAIQKRVADLMIADGRFAEAAPILDQLAIDAVQDDQFWATYVTAVRRLKRLTPTTQTTIDEIYQQLVTIEGSSLDLKAELAEYFANAGAGDKASRLLALCVKQVPENLAMRKRYAEVLHDAGQFVAADEQYQLLLDASKGGLPELKPVNGEKVSTPPKRRPVISLAHGLLR